MNFSYIFQLLFTCISDWKRFCSTLWLIDDSLWTLLDTDLITTWASEISDHRTFLLQALLLVYDFLILSQMFKKLLILLLDLLIFLEQDCIFFFEFVVFQIQGVEFILQLEQPLLQKLGVVWVKVTGPMLPYGVVVLIRSHRLLVLRVRLLVPNSEISPRTNTLSVSTVAVDLRNLVRILHACLVILSRIFGSLYDRRQHFEVTRIVSLMRIIFAHTLIKIVRSLVIQSRALVNSLHV